jgi:hypothetical protein
MRNQVEKAPPPELEAAAAEPDATVMVVVVEAGEYTTILAGVKVTLRI